MNKNGDQANRISGPLIDALERYKQEGAVRLHVPGHAGGGGRLNESFLDTLRGICIYDATEIEGLDHLHAAQGVIAEAMQRASMIFSVNRTYFVVGGSTAGILASLRAVARPGELVLMDRTVHLAAVQALSLFGIGAVVIAPEIDLRTKRPTMMSVSLASEALKRYALIKAIYITTPNYYGVAENIEPFVQLAHAHGIPLIVDEAHGAHFGFHPKFPRSARQAGADLVIQSTHKMLPALTMGAMVHHQGSFVSEYAISTALRAVQTSSPSYLVMASLDAVCGQLDAYGTAWFEPALNAVDRVRKRLAPDQTQKMSCVSAVACAQTGRHYDPLKVLLYDHERQYTGHVLAKRLREQGFVVEMSDELYAVAVFGVHHTPDIAEKMIASVQCLPIKPTVDRKVFAEHRPMQWWHELISEPFYVGPLDGRDVCWLSLNQAEGRRCAELVTPYPPGIPIVWPGERLTRAHIDVLSELREQKVIFSGVADATLQQVGVYEDG